MFAANADHLLCEVPGTAVTSHHQQSVFKQQQFILSQFQMQEVQNQGASRATFPPKTLGNDPSFLLLRLVTAGNPWCLWLVAASVQSLPPLSHGLLPVCLCVSSLLPLTMDIHQCIYRSL